MARNLKARIKTLEAAQVDHSKVSGVLTLLPGETVSEGLARAENEGRTGGFLVVPPVMSVEDWEDAMRNPERSLQEQIRILG